MKLKKLLFHRFIKLSIFSWAWIGNILLLYIEMIVYKCCSMVLRDVIFSTSVAAFTLILMVIATEYAINYMRVFKQTNQSKLNWFIFNIALPTSIISWSIVLSMLFASNNLDVRGWWAFILFFSPIIVALYAFPYALLACWLSKHLGYTILFSALCIVGLQFPSHQQNIFFIILLGAHGLFCIVYKALSFGET